MLPHVADQLQLLIQGLSRRATQEPLVGQERGGQLQASQDHPWVFDEGEVVHSSVEGDAADSQVTACYGEFVLCLVPMVVSLSFSRCETRGSLLGELKAGQCLQQLV